jgi:ectoine hydroxylase-related dioxygenase (phytanoyl-CoA dioxygenase family)
MTMADDATVLISDEQVEQFHRDGALVLRGVFNDWVEGARQAIEENKQNPSWRERTYRPDDGSAPFFQDYCVWADFAGYKALAADSAMPELAARLMGSKTARMFHDHILVKEPGNSVVTPWHQDQPYYLVEASQCVSFWVPLDPVPRDRTIEYIGGSHNWGKSFRPTRFDGTDLFPGDTSELVPDVARERDNLNILGWAVEPGDAVAFSFRTLHGAPANASSARRRVISLRWVGDDARFVQRAGTSSPAYPDLTFEDGAPFGGDLFPVLYPRP